MAKLGFFNGCFLTQVASARAVREIVVTDGTITDVGEAGKLRRDGSAVHWIDLEGRSVVPGFVDAHCHFFLRLFKDLWIDCSDGDHGRLAEHGSPLWIRGRQPPHWARHPSLRDLDAVEPERPMIVVEQGYHGCALNSAARALLAAAHPREFDALLRRPETHGRTTLTNLPSLEATTSSNSSAVFESAMGLAENASRDWFQDHYEEMLLDRFRETVGVLTAAGVTAVCDAAATPRLRALHARAQRAGLVNITIATLDVGKHGFFHPPLDTLDAADIRGGQRMLKLFVDGGRQCLIESPDGETFGHSFYGEESLLEICRAARRRGLGLAFHAMGNGAARRVIRVCQRLERSGLYRPEIFRMEHGALMTDELARSIAQLALPLVVQPHWVRWLGQRWLDAPYSFLRFLPFKTLLMNGVKLAGSSDCTDGSYPSPLESIASAVSRQTGAGSVCEIDEALDPADALLMHTKHAAEVCGLGQTHGTIEIEKQADLVVLNGDPLDKAALLSGNVRVHRVYIKGVPLTSLGGSNPQAAELSPE